MEISNNKASKKKAIIGVLLALIWFVVISFLDRIGHFPTGHVAGIVAKWSILFIVLLWAIRAEGLSLAALGVKRPTMGTLFWAVVAVLAIFTSMAAYYRIIAPLIGLHGTVPAAVNTIAGAPLYAVVFTCLSAGIVEEMVFRFYPISRLHWLTGSKWIASIIPMIVFVGLHIPSFGLEQVIPVTLGAIVFTLLYWARRDYWCNALAHFLVDFCAFGMAWLSVHR
jgi:membrane protease YdiL (CAAX protease family)